MNQKQLIAKVNAYNTQLEDIDKQKQRLCRKKKSIEEKLYALKNTCTHEYADGKSAIEGGLEFNMCKICGWDDWY